VKIFNRDFGLNDRFQGIQLGDEARDTLTDFKGIVVALNSNISGCDQIALQPELCDGKFEDSRWFDVERIETIQPAKVQFTQRRTGRDTIPHTRTPKGGAA
jgi:hypothetical protein